MAEGIIKEVIAKAQNRRSFVRKIGMASAAVAAAGVAPTVAKAQSTGSAANDQAILNFALNLEYLEAEFYSYATWGFGIDGFGVDLMGGTGATGATTGGHQVSFSDGNVYTLAQSLFNDEFDHVVLLQNYLQYYFGVTHINKPAINLNALGFGFGSDAEFLLLGRAFEEVGVSAYGGAAPLLYTSQTLANAARILATEGEHAGALRAMLAIKGITVPSALDGADILPPPASYKWFSTNSYGLTETRTPQQCLYIAYGAANATSGGFFPNGVNGTITTSSAAPASLDGNVITASPNPISATDGSTTLTWNAIASGAAAVEIRIDSPDGPLFTENGPIASATTGNWVTDGMTFFLQDASQPMTLAYTLAAVVVHVSPS